MPPEHDEADERDNTAEDADYPRQCGVGRLDLSTLGVNGDHDQSSRYKSAPNRPQDRAQSPQSRRVCIAFSGGSEVRRA